MAKIVLGTRANTMGVLEQRQREVARAMDAVLGG
jgi:hypothetical protein